MELSSFGHDIVICRPLQLPQVKLFFFLVAVGIAEDDGIVIAFEAMVFVIASVGRKLCSPQTGNTSNLPLLPSILWTL